MIFGTFLLPVVMFRTDDQQGHVGISEFTFLLLNFWVLPQFRETSHLIQKAEWILAPCLTGRI